MIEKIAQNKISIRWVTRELGLSTEWLAAKPHVVCE